MNVLVCVDAWIQDRTISLHGFGDPVFKFMGKPPLEQGRYLLDMLNLIKQLPNMLIVFDCHEHIQISDISGAISYS